MLHLSSKGYTFDDKSEGQDPVEALKWLLSAERRSIDSFERCLNTPAAASLHAVAAACLDLHAINIQLLSERLTQSGAETEQIVDLWHSFLALLSSATSALGAEAILGALRQHEQALLAQYETMVRSFDGENLQLLQGQLIPNEVKVCQLLGGIRSDGAEILNSTAMPLNLNWA